MSGRNGVQPYPFLAKALVRGGWLMQHSWPLNQKERKPITTLDEARWTPRVGLDRYGEVKIPCPLRRCEPWTIQPATSSYTDYAILVPKQLKISNSKICLKWNLNYTET
jgi:hypothetical protein